MLEPVDGMTPQEFAGRKSAAGVMDDLGNFATRDPLGQQWEFSAVAAYLAW